MNWVIEGNPEREKVQQVVDMSQIRYGFEAGTTAPPGDDSAHGEMVAFNGNGFVKSTRTGSASAFMLRPSLHTYSMISHFREYLKEVYVIIRYTQWYSYDLLD